MPYYTYQCEECGAKLDIRASIREKEAGLKTECPQCHSTKMKQMITAGWTIVGNSQRNGGSSGCSGNNSGCCG